MFRQFLEAVSGGVPQPAAAGARTPYDIAKAEMDLDVREVPGDANNPRIVMYHATAGGAAARSRLVLVLRQLLRRASWHPRYGQQMGHVLARQRLGPRRHRYACGRRHRGLPAPRGKRSRCDPRRPCRLPRRGPRRRISRPRRKPEQPHQDFPLSSERQARRLPLQTSVDKTRLAPHFEGAIGTRWAAGGPDAAPGRL